MNELMNVAFPGVALAKWRLLHADRFTPRTSVWALKGPAARNQVTPSTSPTAELNEAQCKIHDERQLYSPFESAVVVVKVQRSTTEADVCDSNLFFPFMFVK